MASKRLALNKPVLKTLARLYLAFGAILLFFVIAFHTGAVHHAIVVPFTSLVAAASGLMMNLFGAGAHVYGNHLSTARYSINVVDGCNGIYATAILISGVGKSEVLVTVGFAIGEEQVFASFLKYK